MSGTQQTVACDWCGEELTLEEIENPPQDVKEPICDNCYNEHFEFTCFWCGNYEHEDYQGDLLVIAKECGGLGPGVYRIKKRPYFTSNYFNMWWDTYALEKVRDIPADWNPYDNRYPSGHLCVGCQKRIMEAPTGWSGQRLN